MSELLTDHVSFSQLSAAEECPYQYFLQKTVGIETVPNAFAQAGVLAHQILAGWAKGEIPINELPVQWIDRFPKEVTASFPHYLASKNYAGKLFDAVLSYFEGFDGFSGYEIISAEQEFTSMLAGEKFIGVVDLVLRDKVDGSLMIVDYKSCSLSSFKKNREQMYRQLLLYGKQCADTYGEFPAKLRFEFIKENSFDEREFNQKEFIAARIWAETVIQKMTNRDITDWFSVNPDYFRCTNLCSCRHECSCGKPEYYRKDETNETKRNPAVA